MFINGTDRIVYIKWEDEFLPIGCLTSDSFEEDVEMLPTTTRDNNGWRTDVPTNQGYSISVDGILINSNFGTGDFTKVSYDRLRVLKRSRTLIDWKIQDINYTFIDSGKGYITNLSDSANVDEFITFNATILGYGEPISTSGFSYDITVNTYADLLSLPTPTETTNIRVLVDEDKGLENTYYIYNTDGQIIWVAVTDDN